MLGNRVFATKKDAEDQLFGNGYGELHSVVGAVRKFNCKECLKVKKKKQSQLYPTMTHFYSTHIVYTCIDFMYSIKLPGQILACHG